MKRILLHLLLLITTLQLISCNGILDSINGESDDDQEPPTSIYIEIQTRILSGTTVPIIMQYSGSGNADGIYEFYLGDSKMEIKKRSGDMRCDSMIIPPEMKGSFKPRVKIDGVMHDIDRSPEAEIEIYQWMEEMTPGVAFRAEVSKGSTLATQSIQTQGAYSISTTFKSYIMNRGKAPEVVKFYNANGREVPGAFLDQRNLTEQFFYARLWNPSSLEQDIDFDRNNYTASYRTSHEQAYVIVDKKSGNIIRLYKEGMNFYSPSIQWMGQNKFCLLPESYSSEYSTKKLLRFEVLDYMCQPISKDEIDDDFSFSINLEEVPYQNNLDITNSYSNHWVASSWDNVYFNRDRVLKGGQLSDASFCDRNTSLNQIVFPVYATGGLYYTCQHTYNGYPSEFHIHSLSGHSSYSSRPRSHFDIYQYADHTYLRAISTMIQDELVSIKMTKDEEIEIKQPVTVVEPYYYSLLGSCYPMISIYDYFYEDGVLYRRTIESRNDDKIVFSAANAIGSMHLFAASRTGCTLTIPSSNNNTFQHTFYDISNSGTVTQIGTLSSTNDNSTEFYMCRLRD